MFQSLRQNSQLFILHKDKPSLEIGTVVSVTAPIPKWPVNQILTSGQEMIVDITVKIDGRDITYQKLPANLDVADFSNIGIIITSTREAMNAEVLNLKQKSLDVINSVEYNKSVVENCDIVLNMLNPEYAERQQQQNEINVLKEQISNISKNMEELLLRLSESKNQ